jgi:hypothetical protein
MRRSGIPGHRGLPHGGYLHGHGRPRWGPKQLPSGCEVDRATAGASWVCLVIRFGRRCVLEGARLRPSDCCQPAPSGSPETSTSRTWGGVGAAPDRPGLPALEFVQGSVDQPLYGRLVAEELGEAFALSASRAKVRPRVAFSSSCSFLIWRALERASPCLFSSDISSSGSRSHRPLR